MHERRMDEEQHGRQLATNQAPNSEEPTVDETTDTTSTPLQHPLLTNPAIVHHPTQQPEQPVVSAPTSRQSVVYNAPAIIEAAGPVRSTGGDERKNCQTGGHQTT
jgi:hypothetical protein